MCFLCLIAEAQECGDSFIESIEKVFLDRTNNFNKKSYKNLVGHDISQIDIINVPVIFVSKEGAKLYSQKKTEKNKLLCYLNCKKLLFDESFIYSDTTILGVVHRSPTFDGIKFNKSSTTYVNFLRPLLAKIREIAPDYIFRVYNLPECYWYIKNNQLFVLYYKHEDSILKDFDTLQAYDFIKYYLKEDDLVFLYHKRVETWGL